MSHGLTDVSAFTLPVTVPDDGDSENAASVAAGFQPLANRTRYLLDKALGGNVNFPVTNRVVTVPLIGGFSFGMAPAATWPQAGGAPLYWWIKVNGDIVYFPLNAYLRSGETLTSVVATVWPGAARAVVANRMQLKYYKMTHDFVTPTNEPVGLVATGTTPSDDGTTGKQFLVVTATDVIDLSVNDYYVGVQGGNTAGAATDTLYALRMFFTDPGPRNY